MYQYMYISCTNDTIKCDEDIVKRGVVRFVQETFMEEPPARYSLRKSMLSEVFAVPLKKT